MYGKNAKTFLYFELSIDCRKSFPFVTQFIYHF